MPAESTPGDTLSREARPDGTDDLDDCDAGDFYEVAPQPFPVTLAPADSPPPTSSPNSQPGKTAQDRASDAARDGAFNFYTRKWIRPEDLNAHGTLFGGSLLRWIDEEATIYAIVQLGNPRVVTKLVSEINFVSSARQGDLVEMGLRATAFGRTSITMQARVRNMVTRSAILTIETLVFVGLDEAGRPTPHGYHDITYDRDRFTPADTPSTA